MKLTQTTSLTSYHVNFNLEIPYCDIVKVDNELFDKFYAAETIPEKLSLLTLIVMTIEMAKK